uniref:Galectin n=1 Tax=Salmo trutta TaxID=8032 RepID=A0A674AL48_SALTR
MNIPKCWGETTNSYDYCGHTANDFIFLLHAIESLHGHIIICMAIELGCDEDHLALHFNPRFKDDTDGAVLVCNSKMDGCWGHEEREKHSDLQRDSTVKVGQLLGWEEGPDWTKEDVSPDIYKCLNK